MGIPIFALNGNVPLNRLWRLSESWVLNFTRLSFWTERFKKSVKVMAMIRYQLFFPIRSNSKMLVLKNYLLLYAKSVCHDIRPLVLNRVAKWNDFCLKQGQGLKVSAAHIKTFAQVSFSVLWYIGILNKFDQCKNKPFKFSLFLCT